MEQTAGQTQKNKKKPLPLLIQFFTQSFCSGVAVNTNHFCDLKQPQQILKLMKLVDPKLEHRCHGGLRTRELGQEENK